MQAAGAGFSRSQSAYKPCASRVCITQGAVRTAKKPWAEPAGWHGEALAAPSGANLRICILLPRLGLSASVWAVFLGQMASVCTFQPVRPAAAFRSAKSARCVSL